MRRIRLPALWAAVLLAFGFAPAVAHEGHDHDAPPPPQSIVSAPRAEAASDAVELVVVARGAMLEIYVDDFRTNAPIEKVAVEVETADGPVTATAEPGHPYRMAAPWAARPGRYDLVVTIMGDTMVEVLPVTLTIPDAVAAPAGAASSWIGTAFAAAGAIPGRATQVPLALAPLALAIGLVAGLLLMWLLRRRPALPAVLLVLLAGAGPVLAQTGAEVVVRDQAQRLPDGTVFVPKASQRVLALRTEMTSMARHFRTVELPGRVIPDPNASGYVQAAVSGRLSAPPGGFPRLGTAVRAGQVLALVTPPFQAIDTSNIRQQASEIDQQIAIVERRLARLRSLREVVPRTQAEDAATELRGLRERRASLDQVRREAESLVAPIEGVVAASTAAAGRIAEPGAVVFQIVDPRRLWVEALHFAALPFGGAGETTEASARLPGGNTDGRTVALAYRGSGLTGVGQSIPIHFAITGDLAGLRVGQLVTVLAQTEAVQEGLALPRAAVLRGPSGVAIVYEHSAAEQFRPHEVRTQTLDGERLLVVAGIRPGLRIVTQGAELLSQIR